jgi:hypothetical protein
MIEIFPQAKPGCDPGRILTDRPELADVPILMQAEPVIAVTAGRPGMRVSIYVNNVNE